MVGDILANVAYSAVGANNHLLVFFTDLVLLFRFLFRGACLRSSSPPHHPAAFVLAFTFEGEHASIFELLESRIPEVQVQDLALAWQEIILDVEAVHGFQMAA